jgi:hypothetical protein
MRPAYWRERDEAKLHNYTSILPTYNQALLRYEANWIPRCIERLEQALKTSSLRPETRRLFERSCYLLTCKLELVMQELYKRRINHLQVVAEDTFAELTEKNTHVA